MPESYDASRLDRIEAALEELAAADNRIQQRHEALAHSVELLTGLHRDNEKRIAQLMETMNRMANIVISHENCLDNLEK